MPITVSARSYGWGFRKNDDHLPPDIGILAKEIENTSTYYVGNTLKKEVYLTFDSGFDNGVLPQILDTLRDKKVRATFFILGDMVKRFPGLTKRMVDEGHLVGSHTYSHRNITKMSEEELKADLCRLEEEYFKLTNKPLDPFFRPPSGEFNRESLLTVQKLGYKTIFWSLAYCDWNTGDKRGPEFTHEYVMKNIHPGAVILLHTVSKDNADALSKIIDSLKDQGYEFKTVEHLA